MNGAGFSENADVHDEGNTASCHMSLEEGHGPPMVTWAESLDLIRPAV